MKILIFGSSGFVGRNVADSLSSAHQLVLASSEDPSEYSQVKLDLRDKGSIKDIMKSTLPDAIINCAGIIGNSEKSDLNYTFTKNILESIEELGLSLKRVVILGSAAEYGEVKGDKPTDEDARLNGISAYAASKIKETTFALNFGKEKKIPVVVARLFNPIGSGMNEQMLLPNLIRQIKDKNNKTLEINRLDSKRDYIDINDVAIAIKAICEGSPHFDLYNIGSGRASTNQEIINYIFNELKIDRKSYQIRELLPEPEPNYAYCANISRINSDLGWEPQSSLMYVIKRMINEQ